MKKVYLLIEHSAYDFEHNFSVQVFSERADAIRNWKDRVDIATEEIDGLTDGVIDRNDDTFYFDGYDDGWANEYEKEI